MEIGPDEVPHLLNEEQGVSELDGLRPMRLELEGPPDAADRALTQATGRGHVPAAPVGRRWGHGFPCQRETPLHVGLAGPSRGAGARLLQQAVQPSLDKAPPPATDSLPRRLERSGSGVVGLARRAGQHDPCTTGQGLRGLGPTASLLKEGFGSQRQFGFRASRSHWYPPV